MLSVDFVREGKAAPKERGQYFGLNAAEVSARLGAPLTSGCYRIAHVRTGLEGQVRISPTSPLYPPCISPASRLHLPYSSGAHLDTGRRGGE